MFHSMRAWQEQGYGKQEIFKRAEDQKTSFVKGCRGVACQEVIDLLHIKWFHKVVICSGQPRFQLFQQAVKPGDHDNMKSSVHDTLLRSIVS